MSIPDVAEVLLVLPPISDITTNYPSTSYLAAHLRSRGITAAQSDWSLEFISRLFSRLGLKRLREQLEAPQPRDILGESGRFFINNVEHYLATIDPVVAFLRGQNPTLDMRIDAGHFLPLGPQLCDELHAGRREYLRRRFGDAGITDRARYLASIYLLDIEAAVREVDPWFRISAYAAQLASSPGSFNSLRQAIEDDTSFVGTLIDEVVRDCLPAVPPKLVGLSVPFPGNVFGAFRVARQLRRLVPETRIALGGGWVNTDLRHISDPRVFDYVDYISLDDGERPLECVVEHVRGRRGRQDLLRTFMRQDMAVEYYSSGTERDPPFTELVTPLYDGLPLDRYLAWTPGTTPIHRVWAGRWNSLTLAHGCYWRKCTFCDISLDYIQRYQTQSAERIVDHVERVIHETGTTGFHWVDEAAPPALLRKISELLLQRGVGISWWSMVRFEKAFTPELAQLLANAGCLLLSGGLEVASDRILKLIKKGVTIDQVARVTKNLSAAGIQVHAFLMYGFPSQTTQETVDSLDVVRQLFANGCIQSAFWHRFVPTIHSPIGQDPQQFGIRILHQRSDQSSPQGLFAVDVLEFEDPVTTDHDSLGLALSRAATAYCDGEGLDINVCRWFDVPVPGTTVPSDRIAAALRSDREADYWDNRGFASKDARRQ